MRPSICRIAGVRYWDDVKLDEDRGNAHVTMRRENTIDRVLMQADGNQTGFVVAAGAPFTAVLVDHSAESSRDYWGTMDVSPVSPQKGHRTFAGRNSPNGQGAPHDLQRHRRLFLTRTG